MITVVNIKTYLNTDAIYIGRRMPGREASPLGNPWKLKNEAERDQILPKYEAWLRERLLSDTPQRREIQRLTELARNGDLLLACWCAPKKCHGDVVKKIIEERL